MTFGMSIFRQGHVDVEAGGCGRGAQKSTGDIHASFRAFIKQDERDRGVGGSWRIMQPLKNSFSA